MVQWLLSLTLLGSALPAPQDFDRSEARQAGLAVPPAFQGAESRFQNLTRLGVLPACRAEDPLTLRGAGRGSGLGVVAQSPQPPTRSNRVGLASWYGGGEPLNSHVAMGHRFNPAVREAAMWDVPFGTLIKVTNVENGRSVIVRITDRGPARRFRKKRAIDLTRRAFAEIAPLRQGLVPVIVERLS